VYRAYGAAAIARGVHSSLSVPLPDPRRPAALNLYASAPDAFVSPRARAVAALLARCTATLLPGGAVVVVVPVADADLLDTVRARRIRMEQALRAVMVNEGVSRADAFALLVGRSGVERRSVHALVDDVVGSTDRTVAS
jgi:hypothetical protein